MATVGSGKWVIWKHSATHGWNNQCMIDMVFDHAYSSRILWSHPLWGICIFVCSLGCTGFYSLHSSLLLWEHPAQSWTTISQFAILIENSIMDVLHWFLKRSLGLPMLRVPPDSSPYSICLGILELSLRTTCRIHLRRWDHSMEALCQDPGSWAMKGITGVAALLVFILVPCRVVHWVGIRTSCILWFWGQREDLSAFL